jgi:DNA-binding LacI/PurR family transcriptional regulator
MTADGGMASSQPGGEADAPAHAKRRSRRSHKTVTLEDVAKLAGVSPSTVSRVVNNSIPVSPELRAVIERAIVRLGYVPNLAARSLAASRSNTIGVVVSGTANQWLIDPFITHLLFGIAEGLAETDIRLALIMAPTERNDGQIQWYVQRGHVDGVILISSHSGDPLPEYLVNRGVPLVFSGRPPAEIEAGYVDADHRNGAKMAVNHLAAGGRRRIATIHGTLDMPSSCDKLDGYRDALAAAGLPHDPTLEAAGNYSPTLAGDAMQALLARHPDIDAVFAASDTMAAAAFGVISNAGLRIPDDIAVVGYDGTPVAMTTRPMLTTVRQPIEDMGHALARLLLERIERPEEPPRHIVFATELIVRESSGAVKA